MVFLDCWLVSQNYKGDLVNFGGFSFSFLFFYLWFRLLLFMLPMSSIRFIYSILFYFYLIFYFIKLLIHVDEVYSFINYFLLYESLIHIIEHKIKHQINMKQIISFGLICLDHRHLFPFLFFNNNYFLDNLCGTKMGSKQNWFSGKKIWKSNSTLNLEDYSKIKEVGMLGFIIKLKSIIWEFVSWEIN